MTTPPTISEAATLVKKLRDALKLLGHKFKEGGEVEDFLERVEKSLLSDSQEVLAHQPVQSSNISAIGYLASAKMMEIVFKGGGKYRYHNVPPEVFNLFEASESKGKFFAARIKKQYTGEKVR